MVTIRTKFHYIYINITYRQELQKWLCFFEFNISDYSCWPKTFWSLTKNLFFAEVWLRNIRSIWLRSDKMVRNQWRSEGTILRYSNSSPKKTPPPIFSAKLHKTQNVTFFFFSFGVLQLMLPEAPQPYGLSYYPRIRNSNFLHQFRAAMPPKQRKLEL
jgi:hypothetical protein